MEWLKLGLALMYCRIRLLEIENYCNHNRYYYTGYVKWAETYCLLRAYESQRNLDSEMMMWAREQLESA